MSTRTGETAINASSTNDAVLIQSQSQVVNMGSEGVLSSKIDIASIVEVTESLAIKASSDEERDEVRYYFNRSSTLACDWVISSLLMQNMVRLW